MSSKDNMSTDKMRIMKNGVYLPVITELLSEGRDVILPVIGHSMSPFLRHERDRVIISPKESKLKRGDIAFFKRESGQYVLHRVWRLTDEGVYFNGDAQIWTEGPIVRENIFGVVTQVHRNGKWIDKSSGVWFFFSSLWLWMRPFRGMCFRVRGAYNRVKGYVKKNNC